MKKRYFVVIDLNDVPEDHDKTDIEELLHAVFTNEIDYYVYDSITGVEMDIKCGYLKDES